MGFYTRRDGGTSKLISVRVPLETFTHIQELQDHWQCKMSECVIRILESGLQNKGKHKAPKPISLNKKIQMMAVLKRDYQFLSKEQFLDDGFPLDLVESFYSRLGV